MTIEAQPPLLSQHTFLEATVLRRSTITLKKASPLPDPQIISLIKHSLLHTPSPFHVQSARAVVLLHSEHEKFWTMAYTASQAATPVQLFETKFIPNLEAFKGAYGTVSLKGNLRADGRAVGEPS